MLAKVTRGNQVTIPKEIVKKAHIREGNDYVDIVYSHGIICIKPVDVEDRIPDEVYEKLLKHAFAHEEGDTIVSSKQSKEFLGKLAKK